jgi:predicted transcriptional regulator
MKDILTLKALGQLKALSDPFRQRILEGFCAKPATTKQIAERLGEKPTKLYHHVEILAQAGLIKLVKTRQNRGTVEKYYQTVARKFAVDQQLLSPTPTANEVMGELQTMVTNALQTSLSEAHTDFAVDLTNKSDAACLPIATTHTRIRTSRKQIARLIQKLQKWSEECRAAHDDKGEVEYNLTLAFYPVKERKGRKGAK